MQFLSLRGIPTEDAAFNPLQLHEPYLDQIFVFGKDLWRPVYNLRSTVYGAGVGYGLRFRRAISPSPSFVSLQGSMLQCLLSLRSFFVPPVFGPGPVLPFLLTRSPSQLWRNGCCSDPPQALKPSEATSTPELGCASRPCETPKSSEEKPGQPKQRAAQKQWNLPPQGLSSPFASCDLRHPENPN